jgi:hypothetical protein
VAFDSFEISSQTKRLVYPVWLRFFTLIAAIAAGLMLFGPSLLFSSTDQSLPWNEEFRILLPGQTPEAKPSTYQAQLTHVFRYKTQVGQGDGPRGTINFLIYPDGNVRGVWNGEYDRPADSPDISESSSRPHPEPNAGSKPESHSEGEPNDVHCLIMAASFNGNVDPSKPFVENGSRDRSNLYFITRGTFTMLETQQSTGRSRSIFGLIYVRGWLYPDYTAVGEIIITENKKTFEAFDWVAQPTN